MALHNPTKNEVNLDERLAFIEEFGKGLFIPNKEDGKVNCPYTCKSKEIVDELAHQNDMLVNVFGDGGYVLMLRAQQASLNKLMLKIDKMEKDNKLMMDNIIYLRQQLDRKTK